MEVERMGEEDRLVITRVLTGIIITSELEKCIFLDEWADQPRPTLGEENLEEGKRIIGKGLGLESWDISPSHILLEFHEVPQFCLSLS